MADGQVVEKVADQIEVVSDQVGEVAEVTRRITGREFGFFLAGTGIGVAAGFAVGYFVMGKRLETKYQKIADDEIEQMRDHYQRLNLALRGEVERRRPLEELIVEKGYAPPGEGSERVFTEEEQDAIDEANAKIPSDEEEEVETVQVETTSQVTEHVFTGTAVDGQWDYAVETKDRRPNVPYIIHVDEFRQNDLSHEQVTYTYYEEDDILADALANATIDDMDAVVGLGNLGRWGHGSNDPNITYVRNEELRIDFEIIRDRGSFHGSRSHIRHSAERRRPVDRGFDE